MKGPTKVKRQHAKTASSKSDSTAELKSAQNTLRSAQFFSILQGALQNLGLTGWELRAGVGAYVVAVSRFLHHPLRVQIQEQLKGTAAYIVETVAKLLREQGVVTITPANEREWARLFQSTDEEIVFIPEWGKDIAAIEVRQDELVKTIPTMREKEKRTVVQIQIQEGRFACMSLGRPFTTYRPIRWLTMRQPEQQKSTPDHKANLSRANISMWLAVQKLLKKRSDVVEIVLPAWEEVVVEEICELDERAAYHIPAFLVLWKTVCLIRSFQFESNATAETLQATFEDLAVAILLAKKAFREASWFPSPQKLFNRLGKDGNRTGVMHPLTGKPVAYECRVQKEEPPKYESLLDWDPAAEAEPS